MYFLSTGILKDICVGDNFSDIKSALEKVRKKTNSITLSGGEVTILDYFLRILDVCNSLDFEKVSVITNARKFSDIKFARHVLSKGVSDFGVSIYGNTADIHEQITKVFGSFDESLNGLKNLIFLNARVWVNITVSNYNQYAIYDTIFYLSKLGVRNFQLISVITENSDLLYSLDVVKNQVNLLNKLDFKDVIVTIRGFDKEIFNIVHGSSIFRFESHEFETFFNNDDANARRYLRKVDSLRNDFD